MSDKSLDTRFEKKIREAISGGEWYPNTETANEVIALIKAELKARDKEWERRIEGMKRKGEYLQDMSGNAIPCKLSKYDEAYNQALSDLLKEEGGDYTNRNNKL